MADTIMSLFKQREDDIFDIQSKTLIESRGTIDPKRVAALAVASPNTVGGLIGSTAAGLVGGAANRPSDTIFSSPNFFAKPVSLSRPTQALLANAIDSDESYYVKQHPSPALLGTLSSAKNLISNKGAQQAAAINILNKFGGNKAGAGKWLNGLKGDFDRRVGVNSPYRTRYAMDGEGKINRGDDIVYSTHYRTGEDSFQERTKTKIQEDNKSILDSQNSELITLLGSDNVNDKRIQKFINEKQSAINIPYVMFKVYGDESEYRTVILPATVMGLSEEINPSISNFKFVGSPFNLYRYSGVERVIRFEMKMYYTTSAEKLAMIAKLDLLREYAFPDRNLSAVTYQNGNYSPIYFNPNILKFTINGVYNDVYAILESLSFTIDDNASWPTIDVTNQYADGSGNGETTPFPSIIDVSVSLKIIEHPAVKKDKDKAKFVYNYGTSREGDNKYTNYFTNKIPYPEPYVEPPLKSNGYLQKGGRTKINLSNGIEQFDTQQKAEKLADIISKLARNLQAI